MTQAAAEAALKSAAASAASAAAVSVVQWLWNSRLFNGTRYSAAESKQLVTFQKWYMKAFGVHPNKVHHSFLSSTSASGGDDEKATDQQPRYEPDPVSERTLC